MSLAAVFQSYADNLQRWEQALRDVAMAAALEVARVAVEQHIKPRWPVDTGFSRDAWTYHPTADGAVIVCRADYSSYVFASGDSIRVPIYPDLAMEALQAAIDEVGVAAAFQDVTEEYHGQGRTTSHLTGTSRKFLIHTPADQAEAWRKNYPELVERITVMWSGKIREMDVVPSDVVGAGQMGGGLLRPRGV